MRPPEPCLTGRCWSPVACNGWGYCRERNAGIPGIPSPETVDWFRAEASERSAKEAPDGP